MGKVIAAYGGGFKPPTGGHFQIVKNALAEFPEIDSIKLIDTSGIIISNIFKTEQIEIHVSYSKLNIDNIENIRRINQTFHTFYNDHL